MQQGRIYPLTSLDVRVRVLLLIPVSIAAMLITSEIVLCCLFALAAVWLLMFGLHKKALAYILVYAALWAVLFPLREMQIPGSIPLLTVYVRRIIIAVMGAAPVMSAPTGRLIASLHRMKLPKTAVLSLAVFFRFMPTVSMEYRCIREALKFRGIGTSAAGVLLHPFLTAECILVPMLMRTSKVADELAASVSVRGMQLEGECSSLHEVRMSAVDWIVLFSGIAAVAVLFAADCIIGGSV